MRAKALLESLIAKHPEWNWEDLEDQGFYEVMQAFRFAPEGDQQTVVLAFTAVKEYIRRLLELEEKQLTTIAPKRLAYENKLYNSGYSAGVKEFQLRAKKKKTRMEKKYIEIADKLNIDLQTVILVSSFVNGYNKDQQQVIQWAKKQYTQNKNSSYGDYYRWLSTFLENLSPQDFALLQNKPYVGKTPGNYPGPVPGSLLPQTGFTLDNMVAEVNGEKAEVINAEITLPIASYLQNRAKELEKKKRIQIHPKITS